MRWLFVMAGALFAFGCTSDHSTEYRTDCNTTDAELQVRIHALATDVASKVGAPARHSESLAPEIEYDIDIPSAGQLILKEYGGKITIEIASNGNTAARHIRDLVEQTLKQNSCAEWTVS